MELLNFRAFVAAPIASGVDSLITGTVIYKKKFLAQ
jgi:hypothetical protein